MKRGAPMTGRRRRDNALGNGFGALNKAGTPVCVAYAKRASRADED
jgi:hypothetical protein